MTVEDVYVRLGASIAYYRMKKGIRQIELADAMGLSRGSLANIETGRQRILLHYIQGFAEELGVSVSQLTKTIW